MFSKTTALFWHVQLRPLLLDVMNIFIDLVNLVILPTNFYMSAYFAIKRQGVTFS